MSIGLTTTIRNARLQVILDAINAGSGAGTISFYTDPQPATGASVGSATLLGTVTCSDPAGTISSGVLTFSSITSGTAVATGVATWARVQDSSSGIVFDAKVGLAGSGLPIELAANSITSGGTIAMTSGSITEGNS